MTSRYMPVILNFIKKTNVLCLKHNSHIILSPVTVRSINLFSVDKTVRKNNDENLNLVDDPDTFGTLSRKIILKENFEDEGDSKEEEYLQYQPLPSQKLTIKQYADIIKQHLQNKRLKEAIDVLEVKMLVEDRVKPSNYIYNILIGACADLGYTKKAFQLFNEMKRRALKPTGDTYTCLFTACANSPWCENGLKYAHHLKQLMIDKGVEPNLTNYNAMIKAFGRCGDLATAFGIVDEMISKNIKIRVHTLNNLLHACISDKEHGLRHALVVWRKMLRLRERPNIFSFNLMLKCVHDCGVGSEEDIKELLDMVHMDLIIHGKRQMIPTYSVNRLEQNNMPNLIASSENKQENKSLNEISHVFSNDNNISIELVPSGTKPGEIAPPRVPNLLSLLPNLDELQSLQAVSTVQDKFAIIGGENAFFKEMEIHSVKPDLKTFSQVLMLIENNEQAELSLIEKMKNSNIKPNIIFYNMLIKRRCYRNDCNGATNVLKMIEEENEFRKKRYPNNKKLILKPNIMTYGVLAMSCKTKEEAIKFLTHMKEKQIKVNIEILSTLLRQGTVQSKFGLIRYIMSVVLEEGLQVDTTFMKHLDDFNSKCKYITNKDNGKNTIFSKAYRAFLTHYKEWLQEVNYEETLKPDNPWEQFKHTQPETLQKQNVQIIMPKKFFKPKRKFVAYKV